MRFPLDRQTQGLHKRREDGNGDADGDGHGWTAILLAVAAAAAWPIHSHARALEPRGQPDAKGARVRCLLFCAGYRIPARLTLCPAVFSGAVGANPTHPIHAGRTAAAVRVTSLMQMISLRITACYPVDNTAVLLSLREPTNAAGRTTPS